MKILVVDDTDENREMLAFILEMDGHVVTEALNGLEALEAVKRDLPDLVLMDVLMPIMDGFESTVAIRKYLGDIYIPILFLTGLSDDETLSKCLTIGGDDFLYKPISNQVLRAKIKSHGRVRELTEQLNRQNEELVRLNDQTEREHEIAKTVFERAIGVSLKDCHNTRSFMSPAATFCGDILLTSISPAGSLYVLMADITGHGLPAAIGALPMSQLFIESTAVGDSVSEIARKMNNTLDNFLPEEMFAAATIVELNAAGTRCTIWTGGLPDILITDATGNLKDTIKSQHMALGIYSHEDFKRDVIIKQFELGDRLYMYTDGITESMNQAGKRYGEPRLYSIFDGESDDIFNEVINDNIAFRNGLRQDDDITLVEITCKPVGAEAEEFRAKAQDKIPWSLVMDLQPKDLRGRSPIGLLTDMIAVQPCISQHKDNLHTILTELFSNAMEHGVLALSSELKRAEDGYLEYYEQREERLRNLVEGFVRISVRFSIEGDFAKLNISFEDSGEGFDIDNLCISGDDDTFGRGLKLIRSICNDVQYANNGSSVDISYKIY
ncbi:MAG: CheY-like chemotaxis protein [Alteromonadaceae bacterium]